MAPLGLRISKVFYIIVDISITGKSNMWYNGVISLCKMFFPWKTHAEWLKIEQFAKILILNVVDFNQ